MISTRDTTLALEAGYTSPPPWWKGRLCLIVGVGVCGHDCRGGVVDKQQ